jgi:hypothetical protein
MCNGKKVKRLFLSCAVTGAGPGVIEMTMGPGPPFLRLLLLWGHEFGSSGKEHKMGGERDGGSPDGKVALFPATWRPGPNGAHEALS